MVLVIASYTMLWTSSVHSSSGTLSTLPYLISWICWSPPLYNQGFPDSSVGKESACNAGDPGSISGPGRSAGEGIGYPLQYSWASLVAYLVKNPPTMWETWVWSLGWDDPLEKEKATHYIILAWRIPGIIKNQTQLSDFHFHCIINHKGFYFGHTWIA